MKHPKKTRYGDYAKWIYFGILANYTIRLVFSNDLPKSANVRLGHAPDGPANAFCFHVGGKGMSYMFLPLDATESTIAHEAWHIIDNMMNFVGVKDRDSEIVAYHLDHLVEKIYEFKNKIPSEKEHDKPNTRTSRKKRS